MNDEKFDKALREVVIFKDLSDKYVTLPEYKKSIPDKLQKKVGDKVIYFEKEKSDPHLKEQLKSEKIDAVETNDYIDPHFMQHVETRKVGDNSYSFVSIDSEIEQLIDSESVTDADMKVKELFDKVLKAEKGTMEIEIKKFKNTSSPAYFKIDEQMKRMGHMARSMGQNNSFPVKRTLVINPGNPLIQNALKIHEKGNNDLVEKLCHHVEDLAMISSDGLKNEDKESFVKRSEDLVQELSGLAFS